MLDVTFSSNGFVCFTFHLLTPPDLLMFWSLWFVALVQPHCLVDAFCVTCFVSECKRVGRHAFSDDTCSGGGGDVSSLTSIFLFAKPCLESLCKSRVITPPTAFVCWKWWGRKASGRKERFLTNALLVPCKTKAHTSCFLPCFFPFFLFLYLLSVFLTTGPVQC